MSFTGTPMECASLMMRNHADPGLIAAYLALELERDPRIAMTPDQRAMYNVTRAVARMTRTFREALMPAATAWSRVYAQLLEIQQGRERAIRLALATIPPQAPENLARLRPSDFT